MVRELGLQDDVVFLGRIPQGRMGALYAHSDLMVYPSLCESFGFPMIEAMGHGLPIVAARTGINEEMCRDAALYYAPSDPLAGAQAIRDALVPETRARLKRAAAARVTGFDWSWTRYAREFVALVDSVTQRTRHDR
jgi:glycosyltransferase involved in cell wall biosynthesis